MAIHGKIQGTVENQKNIGKIYKNSKFGIYGTVENLASLNLDKSKEMEVAMREEIRRRKSNHTMYSRQPKSRRIRNRNRKNLQRKQL